jgi:hypothetical protein
MGSEIVVADTSVIINFLRIDRMDLIGAHPSSFIVTDHVAVEIADSYPEQQARFQAALRAGHVTQHRIDEPAEMDIFLRLSARGRLGAGERSAIAVALNKGYKLAIDDSRAIRRALKEDRHLGNPIDIVRSSDVVVELIRRGVLTVEQADAIKDLWSNEHRFRLKCSTFRELL